MGLEARERTLLYHTATRCTSSRVVDLGLVPPYAPIETQEVLYFSHSCRKKQAKPANYSVPGRGIEELPFWEQPIRPLLVGILLSREFIMYLCKCDRV